MLSIPDLIKIVEGQIPSLNKQNLKQFHNKTIHEKELPILYAGYRYIHKYESLKYQKKINLIKDYYLEIQGLVKAFNEDYETIIKPLNDENKEHGFSSQVNFEQLELNINNTTMTFIEGLEKTIENFPKLVGENFKQEIIKGVTKIIQEKVEQLKTLNSDYTEKVEQKNEDVFLEYTNNIITIVKSINMDLVKIDNLVYKEKEKELLGIQKWFLNLLPAKNWKNYKEFTEQAKKEFNKKLENQIDDDNKKKKEIEHQFNLVWSLKQKEFIDKIDEWVEEQSSIANNSDLAKEYKNFLEFLDNQYSQLSQQVTYNGVDVKSLEELEIMFETDSNSLFADFFKKYFTYNLENNNVWKISKAAKDAFFYNYNEKIKAFNLSNLLNSFYLFFQNKSSLEPNESTTLNLENLAHKVAENWEMINQDLESYLKIEKILIKKNEENTNKLNDEISKIKNAYLNERELLNDFMKIVDDNLQQLDWYSNSLENGINNISESTVQENISDLALFKKYPDFKEYNTTLLELKKNIIQKEKKLSELDLNEIDVSIKFVNNIKVQEFSTKKFTEDKNKLQREIINLKNEISAKESEFKPQLFQKYSAFEKYANKVYAQHDKIQKEQKNLELINKDLNDQISNISEENKNDIKAKKLKINKEKQDLKIKFQKTPEIIKIKKTYQKNYKTIFNEQLSPINNKLKTIRNEFTFATKVKKFISFGWYKTKEEKEQLRAKKHLITELIQQKVNEKFESWFIEVENSKDLIKNHSITKVKSQLKLDLVELQEKEQNSEIEDKKIKILQTRAEEQSLLLEKYQDALNNRKIKFRNQQEAFLNEEESRKLEDLRSSHFRSSENIKGESQGHISKFQENLFNKYLKSDKIDQKLLANLEKLYGENILLNALKNLKKQYPHISYSTYFNQREQTLIQKLITSRFNFPSPQSPKQVGNTPLTKTVIPELGAKYEAKRKEYETARKSLSQWNEKEEKIKNWLTNKTKNIKVDFEEYIENNETNNYLDTTMQLLITEYRQSAQKLITEIRQNPQKYSLKDKEKESSAFYQQNSQNKTNVKNSNLENNLFNQEFEKLTKTANDLKLKVQKDNEFYLESSIFANFLSQLSNSLDSTQKVQYLNLFERIHKFSSKKALESWDIVETSSQIKESKETLTESQEETLSNFGNQSTTLSPNLNNSAENQSLFEQNGCIAQYF